MAIAIVTLNQFRKHWPVVAAIMILLYGFASYLSGDPLALQIIGSFGVLISFGGAAYTTLKTSRNSTQLVVSRSWMFLGIGFLLWALANLIETAIWIFYSSQLSIPSIADLLRNAGSVAAVVALAVYPSSQEKFFGRIRIMLDISLLCIAAFILFWLIFLRPVILVGFVDIIMAIWVQARVAFDLALIVLLLRIFILTNSFNERNAILSLGAGAILLTLADLMHSYQQLMGTFTGISLLKAIWMFAGLLFTVSSIYLLPKKPSVPRGWLPRQNLRARFEPLLSIAMAYIVICFVAGDWWLSGELDGIAFPALILIALLLITRQAAIAGQSELRQHAELVNSTADFAFVCNAKGVIRLANPALRASLGFEEEPKLSFNLKDFLRTDFSPEDLFQSGSSSGWSGEVQFLHKDGSLFPVSLSLKPIQDEQREDNLYAAIAHDLSETKRREGELRNTLEQLADTEEELRSLNRELEAKVEVRTQELEDMVSHLARLNEELKALDTLKSEFVALVSHELRAPLTNIRTGLEVLLHGLPDVGVNTRESLELIMSETERLSSFVEMILDLSALEAGRFQLQIREIPVEKVVQDVVYRFSHQPNSDRIVVDLPDGLPFVHADEQALHSILFHLIDNALKYAPEGEVQVRAADQETSVQLQVIDAGPGIPTEARERVFEMFYRFDTSDARKVYGRGLGLNLAKRFLDLMDGGIQIKDAEGQGTDVEFWLPKSDQL